MPELPSINALFAIALALALLAILLPAIDLNTTHVSQYEY